MFQYVIGWLLTMASVSAAHGDVSARSSTSMHTYAIPPVGAAARRRAKERIIGVPSGTCRNFNGMESKTAAHRSSSAGSPKSTPVTNEHCVWRQYESKLNHMRKEMMMHDVSVCSEHDMLIFCKFLNSRLHDILHTVQCVADHCRNAKLASALETLQSNQEALASNLSARDKFAKILQAYVLDKISEEPDLYEQFCHQQETIVSVSQAKCEAANKRMKYWRHQAQMEMDYLRELCVGNAKKVFIAMQRQSGNLQNELAAVRDLCKRVCAEKDRWKLHMVPTVISIQSVSRAVFTCCNTIKQNRTLTFNGVPVEGVCRNGGDPEVGASNGQCRRSVLSPRKISRFDPCGEDLEIVAVDEALDRRLAASENMLLEILRRLTGLPSKIQLKSAKLHAKFEARQQQLDLFYMGRQAFLAQERQQAQRTNSKDFKRKENDAENVRDNLRNLVLEGADPERLEAEYNDLRRIENGNLDYWTVGQGLIQTIDKLRAEICEMEKQEDVLKCQMIRRTRPQTELLMPSGESLHISPRGASQAAVQKLYMPRSVSEPGLAKHVPLLQLEHDVHDHIAEPDEAWDFSKTFDFAQWIHEAKSTPVKPPPKKLTDNLLDAVWGNMQNLQHSYGLLPHSLE